jgi:glyoxylase-like metal-dependent hydrolase (beta-lactamase superfamily II)
MSNATRVARRDLLRWGAAAAVLPSTAAAALVSGAGAATGDPPATTSSPSAPPRFERFKVGAIEGIVLSDGTAAVKPIQPTFGADAKVDDLNAALDRAFHPRDRASLAFNPVLLRIGSDLVLVDAGNAAAGSADAPVGHLVTNLRAAGVRPEDITALIITHGHGDHIGGLGTKAAPTYPNAKIFISKPEYDFWTSGSPDFSRSLLPPDTRNGMAAAAKRQLEDFTPRIERFDLGATLFPGLEVIDTNGHTPGHISLMVEDGGESICVLGDVAHNHVIMLANPDWKVAFDTDPTAGAAARRKIFDRLAADRTLVLGYHLPWPAFGHVRRLSAGNGAASSGYEWVVAPLV